MLILEKSHRQFLRIIWEIVIYLPCNDGVIKRENNNKTTNLYSRFIFFISKYAQKLLAKLLNFNELEIN